MTKHKKEILFGSLILFTAGILIYLETQLPFFKKFIPVGENKLIVIVLNINLLLILLLLFLVTRTLIKTYVEKKRGIWGSKLKTKLTLTLLIVSIIPSFVLFILATGFFHMSIDKWFSQKIEDTVGNALELSQFYYDDLFQRYSRTGDLIARDIETKNLLDDDDALNLYISRVLKTYLLGFISVYDPSGDLIAASDDVKKEVRNKVSEKSRVLLKQPRMRSIISLKEGEAIIVGKRIVDQGGETRALLVVGEILKVHGSERIKEITLAHKEYVESRPLKKILKWGFIVPLSLITIMTIFFSVWVGVKMATEITVPIQRVKEGASIIAKGKFDINLEDRGKDEISTLVTAFNTMARELKITKEEIEEKRRYIEVILDNVASGIISTDNKGGIVLFNTAARNILRIDHEVPPGTSLREIFGDEYRTMMRSFLKELRESGGRSVTQEMKLSLKQKDVTYLRSSLTVLKDEANKPAGFIITFDDISHIVRAEKLATWREVARKLTHEIKNPLTPIMLSAERIRRKLLPFAQEDDKGVLDETTSVIIRSVQDIKGIVNELTKLTHSSQIRTVEDINSIVEETMTLYKDLYQTIRFEVTEGEMPQFKLDRDGVKRALINLITNSVKALAGSEGVISITTRYDKITRTCITEVADTGKGIPDEDKGRIFDPYFTKDKDGTGLGLAIVHSIVLEHHGKIFVEDNKPRGAKFIIELPVIET
jgi:two-component system nitrogen regulation sensor histidine kinase NtrY